LAAKLLAHQLLPPTSLPCAAAAMLAGWEAGCMLSSRGHWHHSLLVTRKGGGSMTKHKCNRSGLTLY